MRSATLSPAVSRRNKFSLSFKFFSILLLVLLISGKSWGQLLQQDFSGSTTVSSYVNSTTPTNGQFNAIGTSGSGVVLSINTTGSNKLRFASSGANAGNYSRTTDFSPTPTALIYKFDLTVSGNSTAVTSAGIWQVGTGFGTANSVESNANTYAKFGISPTATAGQFTIRDITNGTTSATFTGTQTVTWAMNNSGATIYYRAPDNSNRSLADDKIDLWLGSTIVLSSVSVQTTTQSITDLKFVISSSSAVNIDIDNILIDPILSVPTANSATSVSSSGFRANWSAVTGVTGYRVDIATDAGFTSLVSGYNNLYVSGQANNYLDVTGLNPSTLYYYRVRGASQYTLGEFATGNSGSQNPTTSSASNPSLAVSGTTAHGSSCPSTAAVKQTYTITNTGTAASNVVVSSDNSEFAVSNLTNTSISTNGTATYDVTFTPTSLGSKSATISVYYNTNTLATSSSLSGTGSSPVTATVTSAAASNVVNTTATLNGNVTAIGVCPATTEKGFVYSVTSTNNDPIASGTGVTKTAVSGLSTGAFLLNLTNLSPNTGYSYKSYVYDGSSYTYGALQTFSTLTTATKLVFSVNPPTSGSANTNLTSFTVQAQRADNSVDAEYIANIVLSRTIVSGSANLSGTTTVAASAGSATFSAVKFDGIGSYTISATSGSLTSTGASAQISINYPVGPTYSTGSSNFFSGLAMSGTGVTGFTQSSLTANPAGSLTDGTNSGYYKDYSSTTGITAELGRTVNYTITNGSAFTNNVIIYIDYDNSGSFNNVVTGADKELVSYITTTASSGGTNNGSFVVPSGLTTGTYRMRVVYQGTSSAKITSSADANMLTYYTASGSGGALKYGQCNDYYITVVTPTPTISTTGTLSAVNTTYGSASASPSSFNVSGVYMTAGISVNPPAGFQVSTASDFSSNTGTNGSPITVGSSGTITSTPVYVRLLPTNSVSGSPYSGNIVLSSSGASNVNVATASSTVSAKSLTVTASAQSKSFGATSPTSGTLNTNFSISTLGNSDAVNGVTLSYSGSPTGDLATAVAGTYTIIPSTVTFSTGTAGNYSLSYATGTLTINAVVPTAPSISGITAGNNQLTVAFSVPSSSGGTSITNYEYSTNGGTNWSTPSPAVTSSPLTITGLTNDQTYDVQIRAVNSAGSGNATATTQGTPVAPVLPTISATGTLSALSTTYGTASSNAHFSVSGSTLSDNILITPPAGYEVSQTSGGASGYAATQTLTQNSGSVSATTIYIRLAATTVPGNYSGNISFSSSGATTQTVATVSSTVGTKQLTINGLTIPASKVYDGTTTSSVSGTPSLLTSIAAGSSISSDGKPITGDIVSLSGTAVGTYNSKDVASAASVTISGLSLTGDQSAYYTLNQGSGAATISAKPLTMSGLSVPASKSYDGNTTAVVTDNKTLQTAETAGAGVSDDGKPYTGDVISIQGTAVGTYNDANVANASSVTFTGLSLTGAQVGNYSFSIQSPQSATITKANQTISGLAGTDAKTTATTTYSITGVSATSGLTVSFSSSDTNVADISGTTVTIKGAGTTTITASQAGNANYNAASPVQTQTLTVTLVPVVLGTYAYTGTAAAGGPVSRLDASGIAVSGLNSNVTISTQSISGLTVQTGSTNDNLLATSISTGNFGTAINTNNYIAFTVTPTNNKLLSVSTITFNNARTSAGSTLWAVRSSLDNYSNDITTGTTSSTANPPTTVVTANLGSSFTDLANPVTFRIYPYGGSSTGYWRIDNLALNGNIYTPLTAPSLIADASANTVDNNIDITFTDDTNWRNKITAVKIGSTALTPTTDYIITAGNIQLKPSGANALITTSGSKSVTVVATGYTDATITQVINPGAPTANSTATISSVLASGATRTVTCTAKDQYNNLVQGYNFKYAATITNSVATTTESYTLDGSSVTSTSTNAITGTTNSSGVATFDVTLPATIDGTDGISLQVKLADGTTSIGSAFAYHELPSQTISFGALSAVTYGDAPYTISATGGASGNPVVFTSSDSNVATCTGTNGTTITIIGQGSCIIHANQAGNGSYNAAAQVNQTLVVNTKALTITGLTGVSKVYNGSTTATFTGTATYSGLKTGDSFTVTGTPVANFADANVGNGKTITITGYTAPSANYTLTQPTLTADITIASQSISFAPLVNRVIGSTPSFLLGTNSSAGLLIEYSSSNTNVATINGPLVTIVGIGTTTITASQAGDENHSAATSVQQTLTITPVPLAAWNFNGVGSSSLPSIAATTFSANLDSIGGKGKITRGASAAWSNAGNSFRTTGFQDNGISTSNTDYFQVTLSPASGKSLSLSTIDANFDGTTGYYASPGVTSQFAYSLNGVDFTLIGSPVTTTSKILPQVDLSSVAALQNVAPGTTITLRYYASGQTTTGGWGFYSSAPWMNGLTIDGVTSGYTPPTTPTVSTSAVSSIGSTTAVSGGNISSDGGANVTSRGVCWSTSTGPTVDLTTKTVNGTGTGSFSSTLTNLSPLTKYYVRAYATNSAGTDYGSEISFTTDKNTQSISFNSLSTKTVGDASFDLGATSSSGLTVTYNSSNTSVATVSGSILTIVGAGTTNITASQSGDANYSAASDVVRNLVVRLKTPTIDASTNVSSTGFTAHWLSVAGATNYDVMLYDGATLLNTNNVLAPTLSYTYSGLTPGVFYSVKVIAKNNNPVCSSIVSDLIIVINADADISTVSGSSSNVSVVEGKTLTGGGTVNSITVEPGGRLDLSSPLTVGDVTFKVDETTSFSANTCSCQSTVTGSVRLFKTMNDTKWYFMAFPTNVKVSDITKADGSSLGTLGTSWFIKYYDGDRRSKQGTTNGTNWLSISIGDTLKAYKGYIFGLANNTGTITLSFKLDKSVIESSASQVSIPVYSYSTGTAGVTNLGWNLIGQPYLSKFDGAEASGVNYMTFSNGVSTYNQVMSSTVTIDPFTAYFVQVGIDGTIPFSLNGRKLIRSVVAQTASPMVQLNMTTATGTDNTTLILDDQQSTAYQIGQDMEKWIGTGTDKPQLYSTLGNINYAFNALPLSSVNNLPLGFYTKTAGTSTIHVDATQVKDLSELLLTDTQTGATVDLLQTDYSFTATAGTTTNRLVLNARKATTDNPGIGNQSEPQILINNSKIQINNLTESTSVRVYDMVGHLIYNQQPTSNVIEVPVKVAGVYNIQIKTGNENYTRKVVLNK